MVECHLDSWIGYVGFVRFLSSVVFGVRSSVVFLLSLICTFTSWCGVSCVIVGG